MLDLIAQRCKPLESGKAMAVAEIEKLLPQVVGWSHTAAHLEKKFGFGNYHETIAFVNALAWICHQEDHHPELVLTYNRCTVRFDTHSVGGVSINDFICAAKANALVEAA
jgi:4a-hydroxytetrahydrobiopterin dehydratase